jgi:hypothetical protein
MTSALTKIATVTASGSSSTMVFTGFPSTYTDLIVKVGVRSSRGTFAQDGLTMTFNSVGAGGYAYQWMTSNGTAVSGDLTASSSIIYCGYIPSSVSLSNTFSNGEIYITDYSDTTQNKAVKCNVVAENNGAEGYLTYTAGEFLSTAAITTITLGVNSGSNFVAGSTATLYGVTKAIGGTGSKAIGGVVTTGGGYTYHTFLTSGNFTPTTNITGAEVLVIAGGGGSGPSATGGGGAGGLVYASSQSYTSGVNYAAIVGAGGKAIENPAANGTASRFASGTVAVGGGGGGYPGAGYSGGSGGGAHRENGGGAGTAGQGNAGANGTNSGGSNAGGGGGAGAAGQVVDSGGTGGGGGIGSSAYSAWATATGTGASGYYAGGGGGRSTQGAVGGIGGGGSGLTGQSNASTNGFANTGGGGGGGSESTRFGNGGSGIIIVRYTT